MGGGMAQVYASAHAFACVCVCARVCVCSNANSTSVHTRSGRAPASQMKTRRGPGIRSV